jgi:hypothetical protein
MTLLHRRVGIAIAAVVIGAGLLLYFVSGSLEMRFASWRCARRGGTPQAYVTEIICRMPTPDAGKPCRDTDECTSLCVTDDGAPPGRPASGHCYKFNTPINDCVNKVAGGKATGRNCYYD